MIPRRLLPPIGITVAFVLIGLVLPQPDLQIACYVASFLTAGWALVRLFQRDGEPEPPAVEDDKHIVLFKQPPSADATACPHCGEIVGLGIVTCPRCGRDVRGKE